MMNYKTVRYAHYNAEKRNAPIEHRDSATISKAFEVIVRDYVLNGKLRTNDFKARKAGKHDASFYIINENGEKKLIRLEAKCGCGSLRYSDSDGMGGYIDFPETLEEVKPEMLIPRADYVIFLLEGDERLFEKPELALSSYVLPRADYIRLLYAMGNGKLHIRLNKSRGQVNIQSMATYSNKTGKWSDKPLQRGYDFIDECPTAETLESFLRRFGRI